MGVRGPDGDLEGAVGFEFELGRVEEPRGGQSAALPIASLLRREVEEVHRPTCSAKPVVVFTADRGVEVVVVGVVGSHLDRLVNHASKNGRPRVRIFEEGFEAGPEEASEIAVPLCLGHGVFWGSRSVDGRAGGLEGVAELVPASTTHDSFGGDLLFGDAPDLAGEAGEVSVLTHSSDHSSFDRRHRSPPKKGPDCGGARWVRQGAVVGARSSTRNAVPADLERLERSQALTRSRGPVAGSSEARRSCRAFG